jgi:tellurite resistance protein TerC
MYGTNLYLWIGFNLFVLLMLILDLGVFHKKAHIVGFKEALAWTGVWISLALLFNLAVHFYFGPERALEFLTGYLIEKSLSVDNIFVILMIFTYFQVPAQFQHKVLFWGILGALLMRAMFILSGVALIQRYHWVIYAFGAFLVVTGIKMALPKEKELSLERNLFLRFFCKVVPSTNDFGGGHFAVKKDGRWLATPLFAALLMVETTDIIFAVDSIPAILAVSTDPFIVYTSNVFAILGLRSLYFAVAGLLQYFRYLQYGLAGILVFVGAKMLLADVYKVPIVIALGAVLAILGISMLASVLWPKVPDDLSEKEEGKSEKALSCSPRKPVHTH